MSYGLNTRLAQAGNRRDPSTGAISMPIYQTAAFGHPSLGNSTGFDYSRTANPTRSALEETLAVIDGGLRGFAFASGMAALDCVLHLFQPGECLLVTEDLYGGTFRLFEKVYSRLGLKAIYVDTSDTQATSMAMAQANVRGLLIESPTNPLLKIADFSSLIPLARNRGLLVIVDNTFMTPYLQRPIDFGADLVVYSATKYLAGHNDVIAGAIVAASSEIAERIAFYQNSIGAILGPQDSWLTLRGLKTLSLRMARQQENALIIARWLEGHPKVRRVFYPGLETHPGHELLVQQGSGFGGMISFEVDEEQRIPSILAGVRLFLFAESLGGVESLITYPAVQTHADMDCEVRERLGINRRLLRLSIGIEDVQDLITDLQAVL